MHKRPWSLVVLAGFHLVAPIFNLGLNAFYMDKSIGQYATAAFSSQYVYANWPILLAPILCAFAIYACKKWSFFLFLASLSVLFLFSYHAYLSKSNSIGIFPVILVYAVNILVVAYFLVPEIRAIYFNPRLRWWESKPRYSADFDCQFQHDGQSFDSHISNFAEGGAFIKTDTFPPDEAAISISFPFQGEQKTFMGQVILHSYQDAVGFGLKFRHDDSESHKQAKAICKDLESQGRLLEGRYNREDSDSFGDWAKTLFTTGKGLFPKKPQS